MAGLLSDLNALYQEKIGQPFYRSPVGQAVSGFLGVPPADPANPSEAYRAAEAFSNMPGVSIPAGLGKGLIQALAHSPELVAGIMAGAKGLRAPRKMLDQASEMYKQGKSYDEIFEATGIHTQSGLPPQFEINDRASRFIDKNLFNRPPSDEVFETTVGSVFEHPELYANYPQLKDTKILIKQLPKGEIGTGSYNSKTDTITLYSSTPEKARSLLIHELDHATAYLENFPSGGSPTTIATGKKALERVKEYERMLKNEKDPDKRRKWEFRKEVFEKFAKYPEGKDGQYQAYQDIYGEMQARNAQNRLGMSMADRMMIPPRDTMDIPLQEPTVWDWNKAPYSNPQSLDYADPFKDTTR